MPLDVAHFITVLLVYQGKISSQTVATMESFLADVCTCGPHCFVRIRIGVGSVNSVLDGEPTVCHGSSRLSMIRPLWHDCVISSPSVESLVLSWPICSTSLDEWRCYMIILLNRHWMWVSSIPCRNFCSLSRLSCVNTPHLHRKIWRSNHFSGEIILWVKSWGPGTPLRASSMINSHRLVYTLTNSLVSPFSMSWLEDGLRQKRIVRRNRTVLNWRSIKQHKIFSAQQVSPDQVCFHILSIWVILVNQLFASGSIPLNIVLWAHLHIIESYFVHQFVLLGNFYQGLKWLSLVRSQSFNKWLNLKLWGLELIFLLSIKIF